MSAITIGGDLVHYEKLGRGKPVIMIHGWIGSWRYWIPTMQALYVKFGVYTLDLVGFGDSAKNPQHYNIAAQVNLLEQFMEQLAIPKAAFIGHGLGGMILTQFALKHPDRVARVLLCNMPLFNPGDLQDRVPAGTRQLLTPRDRYRLAPEIPEDQTLPSEAKSGGKAEKQNGMHTPFHELPTVGRPDKIDREQLRRAAELRDQARSRSNPLLEAFKDRSVASLLDKCFRKNEAAYDKLRVDVDKCDVRVLEETAVGFDAGEMLDDLRRITAPLVLVHGKDDNLFPDPDEEVWNYLTINKEDVCVPIPLPGVRHFPMLEHEAFSRLAQDFLETSDISNLELRERWRRRSR